MSRKKPNTVKVKSEYVVEPEEAYEAKVVASGTGAVIKSYKKYLGKDVLVIIKGKDLKPTKMVDGVDVSDVIEHSW